MQTILRGAGVFLALLFVVIPVSAIQGQGLKKTPKTAVEGELPFYIV